MKIKSTESNFFGADGNPPLAGREHEKTWTKCLGILMLLFAIGFNLWIYRLEPTAKIDPNDNTFQFALVERTDQIWEYDKRALFDHWVPNWAQGYNLPYYYSHIPQIIIVAAWRLFHIGTLFQFYHWVIYLLLCFFPLSVFLALRIIGLSSLSAGFGALAASQLSTDGLYGLDPSSFLWRGYGLSSQLFAMIFLPLAIAFAYKRRVIPTIVFLTATTAGHLGIGIMAFMSVGIVFLGNVKKLFFIYGGVFLLLGYWILPILLNGNYHNISFWDPVWKFDSYGAIPTLTRLFNGELFDFGRLPMLTILVFVGLFSYLSFRAPTWNPSDTKHWTPDQVRGDIGILFLFWLLMYFGRTTWGGIIDLIPGMADFHLSRFIVGVHMAGIFLIPMAFEKIKKYHPLLPFILLIPLIPVYQQTIKYSQYNDVLITQANENYTKQIGAAEELLTTLQALQAKNPGRVYAGRAGWGKDFRIAETPYNMYLSTYGIPTVLWLPETWSPNSDVEQYFSEDQEKDYELFNIRYVATPPDLKPQPFWKLLKKTDAWKLYEVHTSGYVTGGVRPAIVSTTKERFINLVRLWIQSDYPKQGLFPELTFDSAYPKPVGLPNFKMLDEVTYQIPAGTRHNLFSEVPRYLGDLSNLGNLKIISQSNEHDMVFRATVEVPDGCGECIVILKQSFHPQWQATVDGKPADTFIVFPFYTAVKMDSAGTHEVVFTYQSSGLKILLQFFSLISLLCLVLLLGRYYFLSFQPKRTKNQ